MKILATLLFLALVTVGIIALPSSYEGPVTPGGMDGSIQFNDIGLFGGSNELRWDTNQNRLIVNGGILDLSGSVVRGGLSPEFDDSYDLGSESNSWAGLYLGSDEVIYFGNVPILSQEVGGGDTYINASDGKNVRIVKPLILYDIPTFDPRSPGHVWRDGDVLKISHK